MTLKELLDKHPEFKNLDAMIFIGNKNEYVGKAIERLEQDGNKHAEIVLKSERSKKCQ